MPAVAEGRAGVRTRGRSFVALALASAPIEGNGGRWLDLCAGPGGKAAQLAGAPLDRGRGWSPTSCSPIGRTSSPARVGGADGGSRRSPSPTAPAAVAARSFDRVLVDAPCTGLGRLRRRPESRWRRRGRRTDLPARYCARCFARPSPWSAPAAASPVRDLLPRPGQTRDVVGRCWSSARHEARGRWCPAHRCSRGLRAERPDCGRLRGPVQFWPHRHGTDAMFLALLRRA